MNLIKRKNKIIVSSESPDLYSSQRLIKEAIKLGYACTYLNPYQFYIPHLPAALKKNGHQALYLHRTTGIRYDDFDFIVSKYHQQLGYKIINPLTALSNFRSKDLQYLFFKEHQLKTPDTICFRGELHPKNWADLFALSKDEQFIIKMIRGNQGIGVNLVNGKMSLKSLLETFHGMKDQKFLIQPFIKKKKEWRFFIIKNKIMAIIERTSGLFEFRGNAKKAEGKIISKVAQKLEDEVLRGAALSGLDYCAIDIIDDGSTFYFLEINPIPGFFQVEKLSKLNIAREIIINNQKD